MSRVGHRVLFRSERSVLLKNATFFSVLFLSFWRLMKPKKNDAFFYVLFLRTEKNATFFCKEQKRTQRSFVKNVKNARTFRSFVKNAERCVLFFNIHIYRYIYIYIHIDIYRYIYIDIYINIY